MILLGAIAWANALSEKHFQRQVPIFGMAFTSIGVDGACFLLKMALNETQPDILPSG
jgi:hypothetical protein